jgi:beta-galactosidase beta subunit
VHFIIDGCEMIGISPRSKAELTPYDLENDYSAAAAAFQYYMLSAGSAAVFFPHEAHVTGVSPNGQVSRVKKLVFKILAE